MHNIYIYVHSFKMVKLRFILAVLSDIISVLKNTLKPSVEHSKILVVLRSSHPVYAKAPLCKMAH